MRDRLALHVAACATVIAILAPLFAPGYVLSYDMVFVPWQPLVPELIAPVDELPRAVPLDALVSLVSQVVPGWMLQRLALGAVIWAAVVGAGRLVPAQSATIRVVAGVTYAWTPFLAERLLIGQWALLVAYACLPWLVMAAQEVRAGKPNALPRLLVAAGLSAVTPTGGLLAATVALVMTAGSPPRRYGLIAGCLAALNSPWIVAALTSNATGHSDPAGVAAFAARSENWAGPVVALLGTGGIWNSETTPDSRSFATTPILTLLLCSVAFWGYLSHRAAISLRLVAVAVAGLLLAAASTVAFGASALAWAVVHVPGAGLLRDAQKFVLPYALLLAVCFALGLQRIAKSLPREPGMVLIVGGLLLAVAAVPDLAYGGAGALKPVRYPADWDAVARIIREDPGEVLSLPLSEYRTYPWNRFRTVKDPAQRYLPVPVLSDDTLVVSGQQLQGESPRLQRIRRALAAGDQITGLRWLLIQHRGDESAAVRPETLRGKELVYSGRYLSLYRDPAAPAWHPSWGRHATVVAAEVLALAVTLIGLGGVIRARRSKKGSPEAPERE